METMERTYALPDPVQRYGGAILDVDGHESIPVQAWASEMGDVMEELAQKLMDSTAISSSNLSGDITPIDARSVWETKGPDAPGATDMKRRIEVLDLMGIKRQLMFPGAGLVGIILSSGGMNVTLSRDNLSYGNDIVAAANEWAVRVAQQTDRIRPVVTVVGDSPAEVIAQTKRFIDQGIRAVWLPSSLPPGGVSPAHPDLDPLWEMLAAANVPVCLHVGLDTNMHGRGVWKDAPAFKGFRTSAELDLDPWTIASMYLSTQNMVLTMVLGGVLERHPTLRVGVIETGGHWIGPLAEQADMFHRVDPAGTKSSGTGFRLAEPPSFYIKRNIKVSCMDYEPVGQYIERYGFEDVYCFASDYPHPEGGKDPAGCFYQSLSHLGDEVLEKFFVKNAEWLLPD